jgi:hypothetical protein
MEAGCLRTFGELEKMTCTLYTQTEHSLNRHSLGPFFSADSGVAGRTLRSQGKCFVEQPPGGSMHCGPFAVPWDARCVLKGSVPNGHYSGNLLRADSALSIARCAPKGASFFSNI